MPESTEHEQRHPIRARRALPPGIAAVAGLQGWRLWSPLIGIVTGSVTAALFGAYEISSVADAAWVGIPEKSGFPRFDLTPGASFWSLLPVFVVVTLAGGVKNASGTSVSLIGPSSQRTASRSSAARGGDA